MRFRFFWLSVVASSEFVSCICDVLFVELGSPDSIAKSESSSSNVYGIADGRCVFLICVYTERWLDIR